MSNSCLICPVCSKKLSVDGRAYKCESNHCFDISKFGYVNLLMSQRSSDKRHGDDKLMVNARRDFLELGHYEPLAKAIADISNKYCNEKSPTVVDIGCGEGYYCEIVLNKLENEQKSAKLCGIDISKDALRLAHKRINTACFAVASAFHLPVQSDCCDVLLNIFAPFDANEFLRVTKDDGVVIRAFARKGHLLGLKQVLYDNVRDEDVTDFELNGFDLVEMSDIKYDITLENQKSIADLFKMTPYYYKTGEKSQKRLEKLEKLKTTVSFSIAVYKKHSNNDNNI